MLDIIRKYPRAIFYAIFVHVALVAIMVVSFNWSNKPAVQSKGKGEQIVQAVTVDARKIDKELKKIKAAERKKQRELERAAKKAERARQREEKKLADAKKRLKEAKQKEVEEQKAAEQKRQQEEILIKAAEEKRQQEELRIKVAEEKRQQEEQRIKELEEQRKKEEEHLAKLEQQKREEELRNKLKVEQERMAVETDKQKQTVINQYRAMIEAKVRQNWIVPASATEGMSCEIHVRLIPSGDVIQVRLTKTSGDSAFDRSVENAVHKASPLPVPPAETGLFDVFRDLKFPFTLEKKS